MHFGEMKFKQRGREEQAEPDGTMVSEWEPWLIGFSFFFLFHSTSLSGCGRITSHITNTETNGCLHHPNLSLPSATLNNSPNNRRWQQSGSFWRSGFHPTREGRHLQNHCCCYAFGWNEIQAERSWRTSWARWHSCTFNKFLFSIRSAPLRSALLRFASQWLIHHTFSAKF